MAPANRATAPSLLFCIAVVCCARASYGESVGNLRDSGMQDVVQGCLNTPENDTEQYGGPPGFGFGLCPSLINCVLATSSEATKAGMAAGTAIAALIPTILVLIGAGPSELIRLSFVSPVRAVATCLFGVGLPSNLFEQLQRQPPGEGDAPIQYPASVDRGIMQFAFPLSHPNSRRTLFGRIALDALIVAIAGIMLWRNWMVGTMIMVTFRCEYRWLLFFWPIAGLTWGILAMGSLVAMARSVEVHTKVNRRKVAWKELLKMSYSVRKRREPASASVPLQPMGYGQVDSTEQQQQHQHNKAGQLLGNTRLDPIDGVDDDDDDENDMLIVRVEFPSETSWRWWNTFIQAIAVGVYLYATFVLCSMLFLPGSEAILYSVCMILGLSAIRIMSALF